MLRTLRSGGVGAALGLGRMASAVLVMGMSPVVALVMPGLVPGIHGPGATRLSVDGRDQPGHDACVWIHHPNHSGLRGSSTVFTFSSLMVPLAMRSFRSPSVGPETLAR